jgi:regulator of ribonuclease activity A
MTASSADIAFATADLCDAHGVAVRVPELDLRNYGGRVRFCGPVSTLRAWEDNSRVRDAVGEPGEGRVLVVDGGASLRRSMLGDQLARNAVENAWSGIVIIGAIRDTDVIATLDLGVLALATCPRKTDKFDVGQRDVVLHVGGVEIHPGNWLYADADGIVISDRELT